MNKWISAQWSDLSTFHGIGHFWLFSKEPKTPTVLSKIHLVVCHSVLSTVQAFYCEYFHTDLKARNCRHPLSFYTSLYLSLSVFSLSLVWLIQFLLTSFPIFFPSCHHCIPSMFSLPLQSSLSHTYIRAQAHTHTHTHTHTCRHEDRSIIHLEELVRNFPLCQEGADGRWHSNDYTHLHTHTDSPVHKHMDVWKVLHKASAHTHTHQLSIVVMMWLSF